MSSSPSSGPASGLSRLEFESFLRLSLERNEGPTMLTLLGFLRRGLTVDLDEMPIPPHPLLTILLENVGSGERSTTSAVLDTSHYQSRLAASSFGGQVSSEEALLTLAHEYGFGIGEGSPFVPRAAAIATSAQSVSLNIEELAALPEGDPRGDIARLYLARVSRLEALGEPMSSDRELLHLTQQFGEHVAPEPMLLVTGATPSLERALRDEAPGYLGIVQVALDGTLSSGGAFLPRGGLFFEASGSPESPSFTWGDMDAVGGNGEAISHESPEVLRHPGHAKDSGPAARISDVVARSAMTAALAQFFRGYEAGLRSSRRSHRTSASRRAALVYASSRQEASQLFTSAQFSISRETAEALVSGGVDPQQLLLRHRSGDWGEASREEVSESERVLASGSARGSSARGSSEPGLLVSRFETEALGLVTLVTVVRGLDTQARAMAQQDRDALAEGIASGIYRNPFADSEEGAGPDLDVPQARLVGTVSTLFLPSEEEEAFEALRGLVR